MKPPSKTLYDAYDPKLNNLNFIRLLLAVLVIFSHSYPVAMGLEIGGRAEPIHTITGGRSSIGSVAVNAFFAISGFLLAGSWHSGSGGTWGFIRRRALRIYPGFLVCILTCIVIVGPLCVPNALTYFSDPNSYRLLQYLYFGRFWNSLPNCFATNPVPEIINGSLWTIKYEVFCYAGLILLGTFRLLTGRMVTVLATGVVVAYICLALSGRTFPYALDPNYMPRFLSFFLVGAAIYLCRSSIPYNGLMACIAAIILLSTTRLAIWPTLVLPTAGVYVLFWLACLPSSLNSFGRRHDLSYGVYLYGWPIQQAVVHFGIGRDLPLLLTVTTLPIVFTVATASWFLVESPALRLKSGAVQMLRSKNTPS